MSPWADGDRSPSFFCLLVTGRCSWAAAGAARVGRQWLPRASHVTGLWWPLSPLGGASRHSPQGSPSGCSLILGLDRGRVCCFVGGGVRTLLPPGRWSHHVGLSQGRLMVSDTFRDWGSNPAGNPCRRRVCELWPESHLLLPRRRPRAHWGWGASRCPGPQCLVPEVWLCLPPGTVTRVSGRGCLGGRWAVHPGTGCWLPPGGIRGC